VEASVSWCDIGRERGGVKQAAMQGKVERIERTEAMALTYKGGAD
jgi:hypothetical protein